MSKLDLTKDQWSVVIVIFFSTFICFFNQTTVNPAMPTIINDFGIDASMAQWLLSGYLLVMAIVIPINAWMIERFSIKKICIFAMGIYTIGCIITALGINFPLTLLGRIFQGIGHGILMPTSMAATLYIFPISKRGMILGVYGLLLGFAPVFGPTYSGIMCDAFGWRSCFYGIAVFAFLCFIGCSIFLPKKTITDELTSKVDPLSLILSTVGVGLILYGCAEIGSNGFNMIAIMTISIGVLVSVFFVIYQIKIEQPMLEMSVFKYRNFSISVVVLVICQIAFMGAIVMFPFLIQSVLGYTPTISGLVLMPAAFVTGVLSPFTGKLFDKYGIRVLSMLGMALLAIAGFCLSSLTLETPIFILIIYLCIRNVGAACVLMNINTWGINSLPEHLLPHGNAVATTIRQISMSFATAISTTVYACVANSLPGGINDPVAGIVGINSSFCYQAVLCAIGFVLCVIFAKDKKK